MDGRFKVEARKENWKYFREKYPKAWGAYESFGQSLGSEAGPLDSKTCVLVKLGIAAGSQYDYALRTQIEKAIAASCTLDEIEHAILQAATTAGYARMMTALMIFREEKTKYQS